MKKYFLEIKLRVFFILINFSINVLVIYFYKEILLYLIINNINFNNLSIFYFIFTDVTDILKIYIRIILFSNFQIFLLMLIYHFFLFLGPSLFSFEYIKCKIIIKLLFFFWILNILVSHNFIIPVTWNFFFFFQNLTTINSFTIHFEAKLSEFIDFYISVYFMSLFYCYFLLFLIFFNFLISNINDLKKIRKIYYFFFLLFSTLLCPPDILSQCIASFLLIIVYEIVIFSLILKNYLLIGQPIKTN